MKSDFGCFYLKIWEISGFQVYGDIILQLIKKFQTYFPKIRKRNKNKFQFLSQVTRDVDWV